MRDSSCDCRLMPESGERILRICENGESDTERTGGKMAAAVSISGDNVHRSVRGNYLRFSSINFPTVTYILTIVLFVIMNSVTGHVMGDQCDWSGNGLSLSSSTSRRVIPVHLRCSQGHVKWTYPRGALRIVLRLPNSEKDFKGCIKVSGEFAGAQLFLVGQRSLSKLFSVSDGGEKELVRCFQSRKGQAAIYMEAVDGKGGYNKDVAAFSYDLQPIPKGSSFFDLVNEECRPCSRQEMAHAYCTSDLVTRGLIYGIDDRQSLGVAEISIKITEVLRHISDGSYSFRRKDKYLSRYGNSVDRNWAVTPYSDRDVIKMNMPRHCDPQQGPGEFVFMGRRRLGDLTLLCATSLADWADIVATMNADGTSHCVLKV